MFGRSATGGMLIVALAAPAMAGSQTKGQEHGSKPPGLETYTRAHATHENPSDLLGGALEVDVTQHNGVTSWVIPGPRALDPAVFGSPDHPTGIDPVGVPLRERLTDGDAYTYDSQATPFSDWAQNGEGSLTMKVVDSTAIDGATTDDTIDFEANFYAPDGTPFRVTCTEPLPHGDTFPTFGGVVTNHLMHGVTGIGTRLMPTEFAYAAFWGKGKVYRDGKLIADNQLIHVMVTEPVRSPGYHLAFDGGVGHPTTGKTVHLIIPPLKVGDQGPEPAPLKTGYDPFPSTTERLNEETEEARSLPEDQRDQRMERLSEVRDMMAEAKERAKETSGSGVTDGQPFIHIMFNDFQIHAQRPGANMEQKMETKMDSMEQRMKSMREHMNGQGAHSKSH
jgi:hypothetical protein